MIPCVKPATCTLLLRRSVLGLSLTAFQERKRPTRASSSLNGLLEHVSRISFDPRYVCSGSAWSSPVHSNLFVLAAYKKQAAFTERQSFFGGSYALIERGVFRRKRFFYNSCRQNVLDLFVGLAAAGVVMRQDCGTDWSSDTPCSLFSCSGCGRCRLLCHQ